MADKYPNQAMPGEKQASPSAGSVVANAGKGGDGDSGGGPYPNPHTGKRSKQFRGGQSVPNYYGPEQLGDEPIEGRENPNATSGED